MKGRTRSPQSANRSARGEEAMEPALAPFRERPRDLERECQIFRTFSGWRDASHRLHARALSFELNMLERMLSADRPVRQSLALPARNLLQRYQAFK